MRRPPAPVSALPPPTPVERLAFALSALCSPYVVTVVTVLLVVWFLHLTLRQLVCYGAIAATTGALIPFGIVYALWRRQHLTDIHVAVRTQRAVPFVAALASGSLGVVALHLAGAPPQLVALGVVYVANGLLLALISLRWKISVHIAVLTAGITALALVGPPTAVFALLVVPPVLWARLHRGRHTLLQGLLPAVLSGLLTPAVYWGGLHVLAMLPH